MSKTRNAGVVGRLVRMDCSLNVIHLAQFKIYAEQDQTSTTSVIRRAMRQYIRRRDPHIVV